MPFDPAAPAPAGVSADGTAHLLLEWQENVGEESTFFRYGRRLQGTAAIDSNSELSFSWDPSYQTLTLHEIRIHRGGVLRNALQPGKVRILEREPDLEAKVLDGRLTAVVVLEDVRPGDVLEYAFTRSGRNPIFGPRWSTSFWTGSTVPVGRIRRRIVLPPGREVAIRSYAGAAPPVEQSLSRGRELVWDAMDVRPTVTDEHLPTDVEVVPRVQLSEWASWGDVADWGAALYQGDASGVIPPVVEALRGSGRTPAEQTLAALRFVQDEIRYLGVEMGTSSHAPSPPSEVLRRRFGDCKDKSGLLVALLRELGIDAVPALVSYDSGRAVAGYLPSPGVFDHVIVRARIGGDAFWLDPTQRQRRGSLGDLVHADFGKALVLDGKARELVDVSPIPGRLARRTIRNVFVVPAKGPATLTVTTTATGFGADALREDWAESRPAALEKSYLEFYTRQYPGVRVAKPPTLKDDAPDGSVTTVEQYVVEDLFRGNPPEADFYAQELRDRVVQITSTGRKTPYALPFPSETVETTEISFPADWYVAPVSASVRNAWLEFSMKSAPKPQGVVLTWELRHRAPVVPAADVPKFAKDVRTLLDQLDFTVPWGGNPRPRTALQRVNWLVIFATFFCVVILGFVVAKVVSGPARPAAPPLPEDAPYEGLGGWLVLVGIGVVTRPVVLIAGMFLEQRGIFDLEVWETYTAPGLHHATPALVLAELGVNLCQVALAGAVAITYFRRKRRFVPLFATQLVASPLVALADAMAVAAVGLKADPKAIAQAGGMFLPAMIWLWYLARSRRVRATFTR
jgi:transglutaminase-like putative cysteine protease